MRIVRTGKLFEVLEGYEVIYIGGSYEDARDFLGRNGVDDAIGELSRGHVTFSGDYDAEQSDLIRRERMEAEKRFERTVKSDNTYRDRYANRIKNLPKS